MSQRNGRVLLQESSKFRKKEFTACFSDYADGVSSGRDTDSPKFAILNDLLQNPSLSATANSINCLLTYIEREGYWLPQEGTYFDSILNVESLDFKNKMFLDDDTFHSLQIFPPYESSANDSISKNAHLSIFELLDHTTTQTSKRLLKSWLLSPLTDLKEIEARYQVIETFHQEYNSATFEQLRRQLKGLPNISSIINSFYTGRTKLNTWSSLRRYLESSIEIYHLVILIKAAGNVNLFQRITDLLDPDVLRTLLHSLDAAIDFAVSQDMNAIIIKNGVHQDLDDHRKVYDELEKILSVVAKEAEYIIVNLLDEEEKYNFAKQNSNNNFINAVYVPQLGYLITVDIELESILNNNAQLRWREMFRTSTTIYFKNEEVTNMDQYYGDIYALISDLEIEILYSLQKEVLKHKKMLIDSCMCFSELEVLSSFAHVSELHKYSKPELTEENCILKIKGGRHALYETIVDTYISNDFDLDGGSFSDKDWCSHNYNRVAVLTGANASGKSVFLTQNGLIAYMAHIGCYVPATSAKIGVVDKILTRIKTRETVLKTQSTFQLDAQQMAKCIGLMTEKSLLLIDEFGKGTDIIDGPALFGAIISHLGKNERCPRTIACTHYNELFGPAILTDSIPGVVHFQTQILLNSVSASGKIDATILNEGITFLYKVSKGLAKSSFGVYCAKICGLNENIVSRAEHLVKLINDGEDLVEYCGKPTPEELAKFQENQEVVKRFLSWDLDLETNLESSILREKLGMILETPQTRPVSEQMNNTSELFIKE
ncbi:MutS family protein MSH5 Ecym_8081 [Eremothecium cymbalariae DBVPG|uniref:DNA mismatch repair proteins mutS family domain-containing protein n=1 Tax=Eremothecium cymbalariae (strain CBS 270.75 / DBVPG 7215 / KCTC 17166 / NRRL Y-17582) TaxID=931890 RepID=G8JX02_ERECY|nr:Hypothetical protein Ecym_8081 [Eremothecium cymbalariae DBVPG\